MKLSTEAEALRRFAAVLDEVVRGRTIVVTRDGRRTAVIGPVPIATGRMVKDMLRRHRPDRDWDGDLSAVRAVAEDNAAG